MDLDQPDIRKHRILILETKLEILKRLSKGESGATLAKQYGVSKSTVSEIKRKGDMLLEYASNLKAEDGLKKRKTLRTASNTALEEAVYRWLEERREAGDPLSGPLICEKALEINLRLGGSPEFKASSGWLKNFKTRHNIKMQDLIMYDITTRALKNKLQQQDRDRVEESNCGSEMQCTVINGCSAQRVSPSDSEMDSQLSSDRTSVVDPEQEISNAVSSILQSPDRQHIDTDDQEYTVSFPTVTTVLNPSDQENSDSIGEEYTDSYPTVLLSPDQDTSDAAGDSHPEVVYSSDNKNSEAVEEGNTVPYITVKRDLHSPHRNSDAVDGSCTDSYPVTSIPPDQKHSDAVEEGHTVPYITVKTDLNSPNQENSVAVERRSSNSYPVTSILPDLDQCDATDENNRVQIKIEIKQEAPDMNDDDHNTTEDNCGPSDKDVLVALDTAVAWLERQPDKNPFHLSTLRSIREYAIYKESLGSHTQVPDALIP